MSAPFPILRVANIAHFPLYIAQKRLDYLSETGASLELATLNEVRAAVETLGAVDLTRLMLWMVKFELDAVLLS